jgi:hypothetical protein
MAPLFPLMVAGGAMTHEAGKADDRTWGEPIEGQVISIATTKPLYESGDRIVLNVRIKNVATEDAPLFVGPGSPLDYDLTLLLVESPHLRSVDKHARPVLSPTREVPRTLQGRVVFDSPRGGGTFSGILKPGEERAVDIDLTRLFDMSLSGRYQIRAQRCVWGRRAIERRATATSNILEITIKERPYFERVGRARDFD